MTIEHRLASNAVEIRLQREMCPTCRRGDGRIKLHLLREARHRRFDAAPWDLARLVEVEGHIFLAQNLLDPLLVVEARDPDLRAVGQLDVEIGLVEADPQRREAELEHFGERVAPDAGFRVIEAEPEDRMAAARRVDGALHDGTHEQERLARARAAAQHDVRGCAAEEAVGHALLGGEFRDGRAAVVADCGGGESGGQKLPLLGSGNRSDKIGASARGNFRALSAAQTRRRTSAPLNSSDAFVIHGRRGPS